MTGDDRVLAAVLGVLVLVAALALGLALTAGARVLHGVATCQALAVVCSCPSDPSSLTTED